MEVEVEVGPRALARLSVEGLSRLAYKLWASAPCAYHSPPNRLLWILEMAGGYYRHVYVWAEAGERGVVVRSYPSYPAYALAAAAPLTQTLKPAYAARRGETLELLLVDGEEEALAAAEEAATRGRIIVPEDLERAELGFEGWLYRTPAGYVASMRELRLKKVGFVEGHVDARGCLEPGGLLLAILAG